MLGGEISSCSAHRMMDFTVLWDRANEDLLLSFYNQNVPRIEGKILGATGGWLPLGSRKLSPSCRKQEGISPCFSALYLPH